MVQCGNMLCQQDWWSKFGPMWGKTIIWPARCPWTSTFTQCHMNIFTHKHKYTHVIKRKKVWTLWKFHDIRSFSPNRCMSYWKNNVRLVIVCNVEFFFLTQTPVFCKSFDEMMKTFHVPTWGLKKKKMTRENTTRGKLPLKGQEQNKHWGNMCLLILVLVLFYFVLFSKEKEMGMKWRLNFQPLQEERAVCLFFKSSWGLRMRFNCPCSLSCLWR